MGDPCSQVACARWAYHFIPAEYAERAQRDPERRSETLIGRRFGDYLIVDRIGAGGFGKVYLALQLPIGMRVALKVLRTDTRHELPGDEVRERFQREAQALAELNHPNIVRLIVYGVAEGTPYLVTEYVGNARTLRQALRERVESGEPFSLREIRNIMRQCVNALQAAHDRGIVHRDIKPENIMLQEVAGEPHFARVLDFGLAKFLGEATITGLVLGTPTYITPEQLGGGQVGPWTDLYALAVIAFRMVTGQSPFGNGSNDSIIGRKLSESFDPLADVGAEVLPGKAGEFFRRALAREPANRFPSTADYRVALEAAFDDLEDRGNTRPVRTPESERAPRVRAESQAMAPPAPRPWAGETPSEDNRSQDTAVAPYSKDISTKAPPPPSPTPSPRVPSAASESESRRVGSGPVKGLPTYPASEAVRPRSPGFDDHSVDRPGRGRVLLWIAALAAGAGLLAFGLVKSGFDFGRRAPLTVRANITGATIAVDGEVVGTTERGKAVEVKVPSTARFLEVKRSGYQAWSKAVTLGGTERVELDVRLERAAAPVEGMQLIPGGPAWVGCEPGGACGSAPAGRQVDVPAFAMDSTEVTVRQYKTCVDAGACSSPRIKGVDRCTWGRSGRADHPINCVSADEAHAFCAWADKRLPTDEEWEKAARGGCEVFADCAAEPSRYPWGAEPPACDRANFDDGRVGPGCGAQATVPVGTIRNGVSPYGLSDTAGNVWEWVMDEQKPLAGAVFRVKGGGFTSFAGDLAIAPWQSPAPDTRSADIGFRCAASSP